MKTMYNITYKSKLSNNIYLDYIFNQKEKKRSQINSKKKY